jgi:hypothetical protein
MAVMKTCIKCDASLPIEDFAIRSDSGKRNNQCRQCVRTRQREWNDKNRQRVREHKRAWYEKYKEEVNENRREKYATETPEQAQARRERNAKARKKWADSKIKKYLEEHGQTPLCECGCGEHVRFSDKGDVQRYLNGHYGFNAANEVRWSPDKYVPAEKFREVLRRIMNEKGLSLKQLAETAGIAESTLHSMLYDKKRYSKKGFSKTRCEYILRRIYGMPTAANDQIRKKAQKSLQVEGQIERDYGVR